MERSLDEHRAILAALAARDAEHAAALMRAHVNGGRQRAHEADMAGGNGLADAPVDLFA